MIRGIRLALCHPMRHVVFIRWSCRAVDRSGAIGNVDCGVWDIAGFAVLYDLTPFDLHVVFEPVRFACFVVVSRTFG